MIVIIDAMFGCSAEMINDHKITLKNCSVMTCSTLLSVMQMMDFSKYNIPFQVLSASHDEEKEEPAAASLELPPQPDHAARAHAADGQKSPTGTSTWTPSTSRKRKAGPGPQEMVKSRLLEMSEVEHIEKMKLITVQQKYAKLEHEQHMKVLKLKEEIAILKKNELQQKGKGQDTSDQTVREPASFMHQSAVPTASLTASSMVTQHSSGNAPSTGDLWQPFTSNQ